MLTHESVASSFSISLLPSYRKLNSDLCCSVSAASRIFGKSFRWDNFPVILGCDVLPASKSHCVAGALEAELFERSFSTRS